MEQLWLSFAKRLQALATTGMHFTGDAFDRERYEEIQDIAQAMLAQLGTVPVERIQALVAASVRGYATPMVDVRGAVFKGDAILLVREQVDGLWTLPGGYADVGLSAARNVEKEILEEAGLSVQARRLYHLRHKASGPYPPDVRDFYKLFFLCDHADDVAPRAGAETLDAAYFRLDALPPLSPGRTAAQDIANAFLFLAAPDRPALFD